VDVVRQSLFDSDMLKIGRLDVRPVSDACGDVERQTMNVLVLPFSGVFSKHDGPGRQVIGTPSHAVLIAADTPYRIGFPGAIGDCALLLGFGETLAPDLLERSGETTATASHGLWPAQAMMLRDRLRLRLESGKTETLETEALGLDLLSLSLQSMHRPEPARRRATLARQRRALERVKEAVALAPGERWSVARLAGIAHLSPFHLCRVFREMERISLYGYVLRERLAQTLLPVLDGGDDLTAIALDAGFASHSHFTERFRRFFGCTPAALRRRAAAERVAQLRKIMTAGRRPRL
jgi:AraC family transcriptional regulator